MRNLGLDVKPSLGNFVIVDFGSQERAKQADAHLREAGILVRQIAAYGLPSYLRMTVGTRPEMERVVATLQSFMKA